MAQIISNLSPTKALAFDEANATTTYIGTAKAGTATSDAKWQIRRITVTGNVSLFAFADSNDRYDNKWSDRTTLSYS